MEIPEKRGLFKCNQCDRKFGTKSNLDRHKKVHEYAAQVYRCNHCDKTFGQTYHLARHKKIHFYPSIPMFNQKEAQLRATNAAKTYGLTKVKAVEEVWLQEKTAVKRAKEIGGDLWPACVIMTWGKYQGQSFKWLLENDIGWTAWIMSEYLQKDEKSPLIKWQKETLLNFCREFNPVKQEIDKKFAQSKLKTKAEAANRKKALTATSSQPAAAPPPPPSSSSSSTTTAGLDEPFDQYAEDTKLLYEAEEKLGQSPVFVNTTLTTVGNILKSSQKEETNITSASQPVGPAVYEGWNKHWEVGSAYGNIAPNLKWMRDSLEHGLFLPGKTMKTKEGHIVERKLLKDRMDFNPPPLPVSITGTVPSMLSFFTTPVFFWRPVGVMKAKIRCPNSNCPAADKRDTYLIRKGYGSSARQVCGLHSYYTLLTERLCCTACFALRKSSQQTTPENDSDEEEDEGKQYIFFACSPRILMSLSPAVQSMFPAVLCGRRAIDKSVVRLLDDKINTMSMTKVQRMVQREHDAWYMGRRDLYQTLLFEAHTSKTSQTSILQHLRRPGTYTKPIPKPSLPSARTLRRAHLLLEMEKMPHYRDSILSVTGEILCIDGTKQVLTKLSGEAQGTMQFVTSVLNEWGQFLTTVVVASESEGSYRRLARGLVARFKRAGAPAPKILYADNNCCSNGSSSFLEALFNDWVDEGMVVRLDIRHWLHRWDKVVVKQTHVKYGAFMSAMAGAILAYNRDDMMELVRAVRNGNEKLYAAYSDEQMIPFVTHYQLKSYVRRVTRGIEETACTIERILDEFKGPAGNDIDGIPLFKSHEAVDAHWHYAASKHLSCMQDPPDIQLYTVTKEVVINNVTLKKYRCHRGSNSLEGLHAHLNSAIPTQCGLIPFQVYLLAFAVQWNLRMETLRVAGGKGRTSLCTDPRLIQRLNKHSALLFGNDHVFDPNFVAPMPPDKEDDELLGVEYAQYQSTCFTPKDYYADCVEEEQEKEDGDEGIELEEEEIEAEEETIDPVHGVSCEFIELTRTEQVTETENPAIQDVLAPTHLHLPGFEEVEALALSLLKLTDDGDQHIVSATERNQIQTCFNNLADHDKSTSKFVKKYQSKWGYSLFGRCLGQDSHLSSAAQKTKFGKRYAPAKQISEDSRLLYLLIKMLRNRPPANMIQSPTKQALKMLARYKRIRDRVHDDSTLSGLNIPLPNINAKSVSTFLNKQDKKANYMATQIPKAKPRQSVLSSTPLPEASCLPDKLTATREEINYPVQPHCSGRRSLEKRRLDFEETPIVKKCAIAATSPGVPVSILPRPCVPTDKAPILLVTPSQPMGPTVSFRSDTNSFMLTPPPQRVDATPIMPRKSGKPCGACGIPQCGGNKKRYTINVGGKRKIFTFCPISRKSTTTGYGNIQYDDYEHFKKVVNAKVPPE